MHWSSGRATRSGLTYENSGFSRAKAHACCCKSSIPRPKSASEERLYLSANSRATFPSQLIWSTGVLNGDLRKEETPLGVMARTGGVGRERRSVRRDGAIAGFLHDHPSVI